MKETLIRSKIVAVRMLQKMLFWLYDAEVEARVGNRCDYEFFQAERRNKIQKYLNSYFGPRIF